MKRFIISIALLTVFVNSSAQVRADGKWYFPDSVKNLCLNYEQSLVALYKAMIERNRD